MKKFFTGCALAYFAFTAGAALAQAGDAALIAKIEAQGYSNVRITEHEKTHVDFTGIKNGKTVKMAADVKTGQVHSDNDKDDDDDKKR
jgi:hypothetical protein